MCEKAGKHRLQVHSKSCSGRAKHKLSNLVPFDSYTNLRSFGLPCRDECFQLNPHRRLEHSFRRWESTSLININNGSGSKVDHHSLLTSIRPYVIKRPHKER